jgi:hypothetical protein
MKTELPEKRKNMWIIGFVFFVIGDVFTTFLGMYQPSITEANQILLPYYKNFNITAIFLFKLFLFIFFYWIDLISFRYLDTWAFPFIPIFVIYSGVSVTVQNTNVLASVNVSPIAVYAIIGISAFALLEYYKNYAKN